MGCCLTTPKPSSAAQNSHYHSSSNGRECAPPPSMEEETVKEVLSETPKPKPKPLTAIANIEDEKTTNKIEKNSPVCVVTEEISAVSEIYSVSESVSTTTVTEKMEDYYGEVKQRVVDRSPSQFLRHRSYSGDFTGKREIVMGRSPAKRAIPSPGRRNNGGVNVHRRDSGESSGRRSRSPANRTDAGGGSRYVLGRSSSTRKTGQSPGRVGATHSEKTMKIEEMCREEKWPPSNESLENPLVSLECFIFL